MAYVTRVRVVDVPATKNRVFNDSLVRSVLTNVAAGIGPAEALEVEVPNSEGREFAGGPLQARLSKLLAGKGVDVVRRRKDNKTYIYVIGQLG